MIDTANGLDLAADADRLRRAHRPGAPLVLANVWDCWTTRMVLEAGFTAIATSSSAVADSLGFADGEAIDPGLMFDAVRRISRFVSGAVPVTADLEGGYGLAPDELVDRLLAAGAVGLNLEDTDHAAGGKTLLPVEVQAERLRAVKAAGRERGVDIVLNARVDLWLPEHQDNGLSPAERLAESLTRGRAYQDAGADCVYPILLGDYTLIAAHVAELASVNANILSESTPIHELADLGVARISVGGGLAMLAERTITKILHHLRGSA